MFISRKDTKNYYKRLTHYSCKYCSRELQITVEGYYCKHCNIKYYEHWNMLGGEDSHTWLEENKQNN